MSPVPGGKSTMSTSTVSHIGACNIVWSVLCKRGARQIKGCCERAGESDRHVSGPTAIGSKEDVCVRESVISKMEEP